MNFIKLENAIRNVIRDESDLRGCATALEHVLKNKKSTPDEMARELAEIISDWNKKEDD